MKKRLSALALAILLTLSGCSAMLERSYTSSEAHVDYAVVQEDSALRVETYPGLVSSFLYLVQEHSSEGSIRLYHYSGDVDDDLASAKDEVLNRDPIGTFAVSSLEYTSTRILTYYEVTVRITYAHSAQEVEDIQPLPSVTALRQELDRMVTERQEQGVFLVSYFSGAGDLADILFLQSIYNAPAFYCDPDSLRYNIRLYPETGTRRIVEIGVNWPDSSSEAAEQAEELTETAAALLDGNPPQDGDYTPIELAELVRSVSGPLDDAGSELPLDALTGEPVCELGQLLALEALCQQTGIETFLVMGQPSFWLIVSTPDGYRHLLPDPFSELDEDGNALPFRLYSDQELTSLGYVWSAALYPSCVGETEAEPASALEDAPSAESAEPKAPKNP